MVGDEIWDQQSGIRVKLGPLNAEQYVEFSAGGLGLRAAAGTDAVFCGTQLEIEVQLILKREEVPQCDLDGSQPGMRARRSAGLTWTKSGANFDRAPGDTIL